MTPEGWMLDLELTDKKRSAFLYIMNADPSFLRRSSE